MAIFGVSISYNNKIDVSTDGQVMLINDRSNYSASTELGNLQTNFTLFRKYKIVNPDGSIYWLSSIGDGNASILPASGMTLPITDTYTYSTGDGVYDITLYSIPTYDNTVAYSLTDLQCVFYNGGIYKLLAGGAGNQPDISPIFWESIDLTEVLSKYIATGKIVTTCNLQKCYAALVEKANCVKHSIGCNFEKVFDDKSIADYEMLGLTLDAIPQLVQKGYWTKVTDEINFGKQICCCC